MKLYACTHRNFTLQSANADFSSFSIRHFYTLNTTATATSEYGHEAPTYTSLKTDGERRRRGSTHTYTHTTTHAAVKYRRSLTQAAPSNHPSCLWLSFCTLSRFFNIKIYEYSYKRDRLVFFSLFLFPPLEDANTPEEKGGG